MKFIKNMFKKSAPEKPNASKPAAPPVQRDRPADAPSPFLSGDQTAWGFSPLINKETLDELCRKVPVRDLEVGDILITEGETGNEIYIVLSGSFCVEKQLAGKMQRIATLKKGELIGEIALMLGRPRTAWVIAEEASKVLAIDRKTFGTLDETLQLFLMKQMNFLASLRIGELQAREEAFTARNLQLTEHLFLTHRGSPSDYLDSKMVRDIIEKYPRLPAFAGTMASKLLGEETSTDDVADIIKRDPSVAGLILKTVNSPLYGFHQKISDVKDAVMILGIANIYQMVVAEGIKKTMPNNPIFRELHFHSLVISHIACQISTQTGIGTPSHMSTIGLMHDLGQILIELLKTANSRAATLIDFIDPTRIGALLLKEWNLPDLVWKTVEYQSFPEFSPSDKIPPEIRDNVAILYLSHLCYDIFWERLSSETSATFLDDYKRILKWEDTSMEEIAMVHVIQGMKKNLKTYPLPLRNLIIKHT